MKLRWLGHSCFHISAEGYSIVIDPYIDGMVPGLSRLRADANAVLCSHAHEDHGYTGAVRVVPADVPPPFQITRVETAHDDRGGALRGGNTVHVLEACGVRAAHLGDLGHMPTREQIEAIGRVDALMIPVGGHYTIDAKTAHAVAETLAPAVVIPMHYRSETFGFPVIGTLDAFTALRDDARAYDTDTIEITRGMPKQTALLAYLG